MKRVFGYGIAVLALTAAPALAQTSPAGGTNGTTQGRTQGGSTTGTQSGSSGTATGSQSGTRSGSQSGTEAHSAGQQSADHSFVMEAAQGGMAEVELGQLASQKAQSAQVKQFAQRMVTDHGKANDELKSLARQKNITIPTELESKHKSKMDKLSKMSGAEFDRAYMQEMLQDHKKDVSDFRKESQSGKDPEVKAWAAKSLPTLEEHLRLAQSASGAAVGTSGTKSGSATGSSGRTGDTSGQGSSGTSSGSGRTGGSSGTPGAGSPGSSGAGSSSGAGTSGNSNPR